MSIYYVVSLGLWQKHYAALRDFRGGGAQQFTTVGYVEKMGGGGGGGNGQEILRSIRSLFIVTKLSNAP